MLQTNTVKAGHAVKQMITAENIPQYKISQMTNDEAYVPYRYKLQSRKSFAKAKGSQAQYDQRNQVEFEGVHISTCLSVEGLTAMPELN